MLPDLTQFTNPLGRTPAILRAVVDGQPDAWLDGQHASDVMSPRQAVAHLVLCDRSSWVRRVEAVLDPANGGQLPAFAPMDEDEALRSHTVSELLAEFDALRLQRIQDLINLKLSTGDLEKRGIHSKFGPFKLEELLSTWVAHDLYHIGQIFKSYSAIYVGKIGPWQNYLNLPHFN